MTAIDVREGWSRAWAFGAVHYIRGRYSLCGVPANAEGLNLTAEPPAKVEPCKHCTRKRQQELKAVR